MGPQSNPSSLSFELRIIRARNINIPNSAGGLFVRCYLSAGSNRRVKLDSQEISTKSDLIWGQTFSLDCLGTQDTIKWLKKGTIVFELRQRSSFIGRINGGSKLVARAEMPWNEVVGSPEMEIEKWVVMIAKNGRVYDDLKPPAVQIGIRVEESAAKRRGDECRGCMDGGCNSCVDYDFFAMGAALEAF